MPRLRPYVRHGPSLMKNTKFLRFLPAPTLAALAASTCGLAPTWAQAQDAPASPSKEASRMFQRAGLLKPGAIPTLALIKRGDPSAPPEAGARALPRVVASGPLKFVLEGFTSQETRDLNTLIQQLYPKMVALYGEPAPSQRGKMVRIIKSADQNGGVYDVRPKLDNGAANPGFNTIQFYLFNAGFYIEAFYFTDPSGACDSACQTNSARAARELNLYNLTRQMLLAFRGTESTNFDAWDGGQADAAALIISSQIHPQAFDPTLYGFYAMPHYDFLNRPGVGTQYFFTTPQDRKSEKGPSSAFSLASLRYGLAQSAWLKVWIENQNFFKSFNAAYYRRNPAVVGKNAQALAGIAGTIVPTVEGMSWSDWLRRQYVLDSTFVVGEHLFAYCVTQYAQPGAPTAFEGDVYRFRTDARGNELPVAGTISVRAFDENGRDITSLSPELRQKSTLDLAPLNTTGDDPGGAHFYSTFDSTGTPDRARITLRFQSGSLQTSAFHAHNVAGPQSKPNGFFGVVTGSNQGRFTLQSNGLSTSGTVERGAWFSPSTYPSGPAVKTTFWLMPSDGGAPKKFQRNTAWSYFQTGATSGYSQSTRFVFEAPPSNGAITASWAIRNANKWRLISLPVTPFQTDASRVLNIPAASLSLARYTPASRAKADLTRGFPFGITRTAHTLYPALREPLGPGRAHWLKLDRDKSVRIPGAEPERAFAFDVPLVAGWNAVGVPFNLPFALGSVQVRVGEETVSWDEALKRGWVGSGVWRWKPEGGYARVDLPTGSLAPLDGYFVWTSQAKATLVFDSTKRTGGLKAPAEGAGAWQIGLSVSSGTGLSLATEDGFRLGSTTFSGTKPARLAAARPPWGERSVALAFLSSGSSVADASKAGSESGWAESFVPPLSGSGARWSFVVDGSKAGERVTLSWGALTSVPAAFRLFLVDETSGARLEMTPTGVRSYSWTAAAGPRRLRIEAVPRVSSTRVS